MHLRLYFALCTLSLAAIAWFGGGDIRPVSGFLGGLLLFSADFLLIRWIGGKMLSASVERPSSGLMILGLFAKATIAAGGVYTALVALHLDARYFVAGLCAALLFLVAASLGKSAAAARFFAFLRPRNRVS